MSDSESVGETMELTTDHSNTETDSYCKQELKWYCMLIFPVWVCVVMIYIVLSLFIADQLNAYDSLHEKNITIIEPWINGTEVVHCNPENPCQVTCDNYAYNSKECEFSFVWVILASIVLGVCSCTILCQICKYGCGYIIYNLLHIKTSSTSPSSSTSPTSPSSSSSTNARYGRV